MNEYTPEWKGEYCIVWGSVGYGVEAHLHMGHSRDEGAAKIMVPSPCLELPIYRVLN